MGKFAILASFCLASVACTSRFPYQDARLGVDKRAEDLLRRMQPEEKLRLLREGAGSARLGIPALHLKNSGPSSGLALAATWDPVVVGQVAAHTDTAFGYYGEDPWLASRMAVAWTGGTQGDGRIGTMLNIPCAGSAGERALNEIWYPPFRAAVEEAGLWSVTSSCADNQDLLRSGFRGFVIASQATTD